MNSNLSLTREDKPGMAKCNALIALLQVEMVCENNHLAQPKESPHLLRSFLQKRLAVWT